MATGPINRRRVLAALGALGATVAFPGVSAHDDEKEKEDEESRTIEFEGEPHTGDGKPAEGGDLKCHDRDGRVCTLPCDVGHVREVSDCNWADSSVTFRNCDECALGAIFWVTGKVSESEQIREGEYDDLDRRAEVVLAPGEKITLWFTGRVNNVAIDAGDINMAISQRDPDRHCKDPCDTC